MHSLRTGVAILVGLLATVPAIGFAGTAVTPSTDDRPAAATAPNAPSHSATPPSSGEVAEYAAREAASANLEQFQGGGTSVYIGGGVVTVLLIVILVLLIL